jgi:5-deoxy-glucuronate isomerase
MTSLLRPRGSVAVDRFAVDIDPQGAGWRYGGLRVVVLEAGGVLTLETGSDETAVLPLRGGAIVEIEGHRFDLEGRKGVFEAVTDFCYLPVDAEVRIRSEGSCELALCTARATRRIDPYYVAAADVSVEVRGGGPATRQINNFLSAEHHDAERLIAVEVLTPEGGWSSYPPHKHDEFTEHEVELEEVYYFRIEGDAGTGFFRCYTLDGEIDETVTVRDGDVFLVPRGYHGPAGATPGHHLYYLNVMAGPSPERVWKFTDDPDLAWLRAALETLPPDPRLPLTAAKRPEHHA